MLFLIGVTLGQNFSQFLENQHSIPHLKCKDTNPKSVNYFHCFWSNHHAKYGDNNQEWPNFRGFLEYQHSISQPKCEDNNQKSVIIVTISDQIPNQNTVTIIKKDRTLNDFWNTNFQFLNQNVKTILQKVLIIFTISDQIPNQNTQLLVLQPFWQFCIHCLFPAN